jgi:hypothetical protein
LSCPRCGGRARSSIAPGYWRCESLTDSYHPDLPYGRGTELCGTEYQEGSPGSEVSCACGTFAIGRCGNCGAPACGRHSKLDETQALICGACWETVAQRHEQEREARLAAWPTAGIPQLLGLRRGELDVVSQAGRTYDGFAGALLGNKGRGGGRAGDDGDIYVVRSMQGKALAHFLASMNARLDFTVVKKRFGREERVGQGWVIWSYTPKYYGGSDAPVGAPNIAPSDYYSMFEDGTAEKRIPRYGSRGEEAFAVTEVISADWYWSPSVVWQVYVHLWRYPNEPFHVSFESPKLPLYAERPDAWE